MFSLLTFAVREEAWVDNEVVHLGARLAQSVVFGQKRCELVRGPIYGQVHRLHPLRLRNEETEKGGQLDGENSEKGNSRAKGDSTKGRVDQEMGQG